MPRLNTAMVMTEEETPQNQLERDIRNISVSEIEQNLKKNLKALNKKVQLAAALEENNLDLESILPAMAEIVHTGSQENNRVKCLEMALKMNGALDKDVENQAPVQIIVNDPTINFASILNPRKSITTSPLTIVDHKFQEKDE